MRYKPKRDLPRFAKDFNTLSPSKLAKIVLAKRNKEVSPESITMWFKRHPEVLEDLQRQIIDKQLPALEVDPSIFQNGTFEELKTVKEWLVQLDARELSRQYIGQKLGVLKNVCKGTIRGEDLVKAEVWCLKHPDRLTMKEVMEFISMMKKKGHDTYYIKRDLKDFLQSKGIAVGKRIAVGKPKGYGKYAKLFVEPDVLREMLEWIKTQSFEAYVIDAFMYKTGTRITATLEALIENLSQVGEKGVITVYDKGRKSKYPKGHPWDKRLDSRLMSELKEVIGNRKHGKIFNDLYDELLRLNREALNKFAPWVLKQYPKLFVNHFWRHMFFQHILRKCEWNYTIAGALGGAVPQSVEESYGKPPEETIEQWSKIHFISI